MCVQSVHVEVGVVVVVVAVAVVVVVVVVVVVAAAVARNPITEPEPQQVASQSPAFEFAMKWGFPK